MLDPRLVVDAFGDVYLSLRGVDRANPTATSMPLYVDSIAAGGQTVLTVRTAAAQQVSSGGGSVDVQVVNENSQWREPIAHSCHFRGVPPNYDPCTTPNTTPDPSRPIGTGTRIATTVMIGLRNVVLDRVQVPGVGSPHYEAAVAPSGGYTLFSPTAAPTGAAGIVSQGMVLYDTVGATDPNANDIPPYVSLTGFINPDRYRLTPYGRLDANVGGDIFLTATGNVTVGSVESRWGDVTIKAGGKIGAPVGPAPLLRGLAALALLPPAAADSCGVRGINVTLESQQIGTPDNFIEVCLRNDRPTTGGLTATATSAIFINEPEGDLRLRSATVTTPDLTLVNDLTLTTTNGSILDFDADADVDVKGNRIVLAARGANKEIGDVSDQLEIDSSTAGVRTGWVYAHADYVILLTEVSGPMLVLGAQSDSSVVLLSTPDTNGPDLVPDVDGFPYRAETIELLVSGSVIVTQGVVTTVGPPGSADQLAGVWANGGVVLRAGDDIRAPAGTNITATSGGISLQIDAGNADIEGGLAYLAGSIGVAAGGFGTPSGISVQGNSDPDTFFFSSTYLGQTTRATGAGGADLFDVIELQTMNVAAGHVLSLDGEADGDRYRVTTTGSDGANRNYVVNVVDTGTSTDDALTVNGTDASADQFLLRTVQAIAGETFTDPGMVTLLPAAGTGVQRVNYSSTADRLAVNGFGGNDAFFVDGATVETQLDGAAGDDTFTFGQVYGTPRTTAAGIAPDDVFPTTETTRGWVSTGPTGPLGVFGGSGDDVFTVNSNLVTVSLLGQDGNDLFITRSLALPGGGYLSRAPVLVDGGADIDTVVHLGTEQADVLYTGTRPAPFDPTVTQTVISGAGATTAAVAVEVVEVDGLPGDDTFFAAAVAAGVVTSLIGGAGSDQFTVTGSVVLPVIGAALDNPFVLTDPTHSLSGLLGPLQIEGGDTGSDGSIDPAVLLPGETDEPLKPLPPNPPEDTQIDLLDVHDDEFADGRDLALGSTALIGNDTFGVGFIAIEIMLVFLGSGDDTMAISGTPDGGGTSIARPTTVIHGGGGSDTITVTGAAPGSALVVYGDTDSDGTFYNGPAVDLGNRPSGLAFLISGSVTYAAAGDDVLDAGALLDVTVELILYGGAGDDAVTGGDGDDLLLGGSGDDSVRGGPGDDLVSGDNGVLVDVLTTAVQLTVAPIPNAPPRPQNADPLVPGSDLLIGDDGDDVLIGDQALFDLFRDTWFSVPNAADGDDVIFAGSGDDIAIGGLGDDAIGGGEGDDRILGDVGLIGPTEVLSEPVGLPGGDDALFGGDGDDIMLGGTGDDVLSGEAGNDVLVGDDGFVLAAGLVSASGPGGSDDIFGGDGDDIVFGGDGADFLTGDAGDDVLVGDSGAADVSTVVSTNSADAPGGVDTIVAGDGNDVVFGGSFGDLIDAGSGDDIVLGDDGIATTGLVNVVPTDLGGNDVMTGGDGDDLLIGGEANDIISGGAGNDRIAGDLGSYIDGVLRDAGLGNFGDDVIVADKWGRLGHRRSRRRFHLR